MVIVPYLFVNYLAIYFQYSTFVSNQYWKGTILMKRLICIILLAFILCLAFAMLVCASAYSTSRYCYNCDINGALVVTCTNIYVGTAADVSCSLASHDSCTITNRVIYQASATCSNEACSYFGKTYVYDTHVESCYHTGVEKSYNVCGY